MFPYGMAKNADDTWTLFNRRYKPVGVISKQWEEWDAPKHKMKLKGLEPSTLAKLDHRGDGTGGRIYFYSDGSVPTDSAKDMSNYLAKLKILMGLQVDN